MGNASAFDPAYYERKREAEKREGRPLTNAEFEGLCYVEVDAGSSPSETGTSVFDPVLCELSYAWYTNVGDRVLDPFAGGSARGVVAERMGRRYTGVELRPEQVEANCEQGAELCDECPEWIVGDSRDIPSLVRGEGFDFVFTCPPYADLEVYSDDPRDISNMPFEDFAASYREIIGHCAAKLADDRFAVVVIGDARGKDGCYYNLLGLTVEAFAAAGMRYYNEAILLTPVGSLPIRVGRQFSASRKLGKTRQNVLTFVKGNPRRAAQRLGDVEIPDLGPLETAADLG